MSNRKVEQPGLDQNYLSRITLQTCNCSEELNQEIDGQS